MIWTVFPALVGIKIGLPMIATPLNVIPAKAGIQGLKTPGKSTPDWMSACAGMTKKRLLQSFLKFARYVLFPDPHLRGDDELLRNLPLASPA